jgi:two-component system, OmpR family, sensor histidine kinase KdpD
VTRTRSVVLPGTDGAITRLWPWAAWLAALVITTSAMVLVRSQLSEAHVVLAYVLLVHLATSRGGRALGLLLAGLAFLCFIWFFLQPYYTWVVAEPLDWLVLPAFVITIVVTTQLLHRAQAEARRARERAREIDRLAALGAETLNTGGADNALRAIAEVIRSTLAVDSCAIYTTGHAHGEARLASDTSGTRGLVVGRARSDLVEFAVQHDADAVECTDGKTWVVELSDTGKRTNDIPGARAVAIPLRVRERTVGVLSIQRDAGLTLDPAQRRFLRALAYYAALGVERVQLAAEAQSAEAFREADRVKDAVIAAVSHDLRTPLTAIKALAHDVAATGDDRAAIIEAEADRLNHFVGDLLDVSRIKAGAAALCLEPNEAEDLVGAALQRMSGALNGREVRVVLDRHDPVLIGRFDLSQTVRILVNLLQNALKYSPVGTPVDLIVRRHGQFIAFSVADRGPGVAPAQRERIFEPFYRPPGAAPDVGGAGLGLPIARGLAEAQGASLTYAPRDGGGSVFTLLLPAMEAVELPDER